MPLIPKPKPKLLPLNPKLHVPVTATQKALLARRKRQKPLAMPTQDEIDKFFEDQERKYGEGDGDE